MANISYIKLSGTTYSIFDETAVHSLDGYWTSGQTNNAITAATNALAETIAEEGYQNAEQVNSAITAITTPINNTLTAHTANTDIHVTVADKNAWNAKVDEADIAGLFGNVNYDKTTQRINFYHESTGGTVLAYIDASDFVKDAFLDTVVVENRVIEGESVPCLVFTWNTDAGKSETVIPIGGTFNPENYYTKTEVDNIVTGITEDIEEATSGKADTSAVTQINDTLTAHTANTDIHVTTTDKSTWSGKQDALVSGTNIKTINNQSLLGSGNIDVQTLPTVQGTTLVFS
jgi:uncharacterized protein (DUF302 family)